MTLSPLWQSVARRDKIGHAAPADTSPGQVREGWVLHGLARPANRQPADDKYGAKSAFQKCATARPLRFMRKVTPAQNWQLEI